MMTVEQAKASAVVSAFGILTVKGGDVLVRLKVQGTKVLEVTFSEPEARSLVFDEFKKAAGRRFVTDTPPEARFPEDAQ